jgi:hypothetical protein
MEPTAKQRRKRQNAARQFRAAFFSLLAANQPGGVSISFSAI